MPTPCPIELYDLIADPGETSNPAMQKPEDRERLLADLLGWIAAVEAPLPERPNPDYAPTDPPTA